MGDRLATLARLRRLEADLARRDLAHALRAEAVAGSALQAAGSAKAAEAALTQGSALPLLAAFAGWLPAAAAGLDARGAAARRAAQASDAAAAEVAVRKGAEEAVATLRRERATAASVVRERSVQAVLDDVVAGRRRGRAT